MDSEVFVLIEIEIKSSLTFFIQVG